METCLLCTTGNAVYFDPKNSDFPSRKSDFRVSYSWLFWLQNGMHNNKFLKRTDSKRPTQQLVAENLPFWEEAFGFPGDPGSPWEFGLQVIIRRMLQSREQPGLRLWESCSNSDSITQTLQPLSQLPVCVETPHLGTFFWLLAPTTHC